MGAQLDLLAGPRQRGRKPPSPTEFEVHCLVADTIRQTGLMPAWLFYHVPNGELRADATGRKLARMGVKPGLPDFMFVGPPAGMTYGYELKRRGLHPTPAQWRVGREIIEAGGVWEWGDSYEAAISAFKRWGALPDRLEIVNGQVFLRRGR